ncbi:hypothetical protein WOLCODRAFT_149513 [Wolfiporia cocos MD-104 SS10]|uniref:Uncharacterized protein n=1 Tax=Wolfiporia cocos (strain MD-104) TaxID=742152 RepID=A0A2H3JFI2_WOLCO|nr:hypothetical protein WOLCODRAFT_149513 [Wolfiporia cocos MD-104 SS10]
MGATDAAECAARRRQGHVVTALTPLGSGVTPIAGERDAFEEAAAAPTPLSTTSSTDAPSPLSSLSSGPCSSSIHLQTDCENMYL